MIKVLDNIIFQTVSEEARLQGVRAFVIGGFVRDYYLQNPSNDVDIVVEGSGIALAEAVAARLRSKVSVFKNFGTAMLKYRGIEVEFVGARKESYNRTSRKPVVENGTLEDDQKRRDFTINTLSFSLQQEDFGTLIDPFGGIQDLNAGLIRTPLDPDTTYSDDPLRMLRAIRFATKLGFEIVPESVESIKRNKQRLEILSKERIADELNKIMSYDTPSRAFVLMEQCGILEIILPALHNLIDVEEDAYGHKDNFTHSLKVLDNVAAVSDDIWLRWAALLHDIGKASTKKLDQNVGWTFYNHDYIGAKMIPGVFRQLKLPQNEKMKYVQKLVGLHMRPMALVTDEVTDSAIRRLLFDAGDDVDDLMILCKADITSKNAKKVELFKNNYELVKEKMVEVEEKDRIRNFNNPITGELIMQKYGIPPCKEIGVIKEYIKNAILDGVIENDYEQAYRLMEIKAAELFGNKSELSDK
ncbi:MAG: HD domain-containing protein [Bacteroidales bacterium]|nr:HD domain-containing protein [Bacteroidales bacterium]